MTSSSPVTLRIPNLSVPLKMHIHGERDQFVSRRIREEGIWEPYETSLLLSMLRPGDVFVDVGANIGYFSVLAASVVGESGAVFAFEPDPDNFSLLRRNVALNGQQASIVAVRAALAAETGTGELFLSEDNLGDHQIYTTGDGRHSLPIRLVNGSDYLGDRLSRMDLLKIDTQGSEYQVMAGLWPLLVALPTPPRNLIELTPLSLRQAGASGRALVELLGELKLPLWIVDHIEHRLVESDVGELAQWCDDVEAVPGDMGFMNILVGCAP